MWQSLVTHKAVPSVEWVCEAYLSQCHCVLPNCVPMQQLIPSLNQFKFSGDVLKGAWGPVPVHVMGVAQLMGHTLKLGL